VQMFTGKKVKVKFALEQTLKAQRGSTGIAVFFPLTSAIGGGGWLTPGPGRPPGKRPVTHCIGGWVGPRAGLDGYGKSRPPTGIRSPDRPARSKALCRLRRYDVGGLGIECLNVAHINFALQMTQKSHCFAARTC
jgi:hypothetical protein